MNKDFVPYQPSFDMKSIGFDEPCFGRYYYKESYPMLNPNSGETELVFEFGQYIKQTEITILAPLYQQAFRWFREKNGLWQIVMQNTDKDWTYDILPIIGMIDYKIFDVFDTPEEAELACLIKLIEIVKNK
jgi:hypothetical protein